jgi:hypothetical protein
VIASNSSSIFGSSLWFNRSLAARGLFHRCHLHLQPAGSGIVDNLFQLPRGGVVDPFFIAL